MVKEIDTTLIENLCGIGDFDKDALMNAVYADLEAQKKEKEDSGIAWDLLDDAFSMILLSGTLLFICAAGITVYGGLAYIPGILLGGGGVIWAAVRYIKILQRKV